MYTKEVPVTTSIAPRLVAATILTMPGVAHVAPVAAAKLAARAVGLMLLAVVAMAGILLAAMASAARDPGGGGPPGPSLNSDARRNRTPPSLSAASADGSCRSQPADLNELHRKKLTGLMFEPLFLACCQRNPHAKMEAYARY
jgi:hypothetical protein